MINLNPLEEYNGISYNMNMIQSFSDKATEDIFDGVNSRASRKIPRSIWKVAQRKLAHVNSAMSLKDLAAIPGDRLKKLEGRLSEFYSIRINDQFRIVFRWSQNQFIDVRITDYH